MTRDSAVAQRRREFTAVHCSTGRRFSSPFTAVFHDQTLRARRLSPQGRAIHFIKYGCVHATWIVIRRKINFYLIFRNRNSLHESCNEIFNGSSSQIYRICLLFRIPQSFLVNHRIQSLSGFLGLVKSYIYLEKIQIQG